MFVGMLFMRTRLSVDEGESRMATFNPIHSSIAIMLVSSSAIFGPPATFGLGLNESGHVVGFHWNCDFNLEDEAYMWTPESGLVTLQMPPGTLLSRSRAVNAAGHIVGEHDIKGDDLCVVGFLFDGNDFVSIPPPPGGNFSTPWAITNAGQVAGTTDDGAFQTAFIWENGVMELIHPTFGPRSIGLDINEKGMVVGWMGTGPSIDAHAFLWEDGVVTDLGVVPGAITSQARAINNNGHIAIGASFIEGENIVSRSFLWDGEQLVPLGLLPGFDRCAAFDINDFDQIVGICNKVINPNDRQAFIWQQGVTASLIDLIVTEDFTFTRAVAINNAGQITGSGGFQMDAAALLLTPRTCTADLNCDGLVGIADFLALLDAWGPNPGHPADLDSDGNVGITDFLELLARWGPCQ